MLHFITQNVRNKCLSHAKNMIPILSDLFKVQQHKTAIFKYVAKNIPSEETPGSRTTD